MIEFKKSEVELMGRRNLIEMLDTKEKLWSEWRELNTMLRFAADEDKETICDAIMSKREAIWAIDSDQAKLEALVAKINIDVYDTWRFRSDAYERCSIFQDAINTCFANIQEVQGHYVYGPLEDRLVDTDPEGFEGERIPAGLVEDEELDEYEQVFNIPSREIHTFKVYGSFEHRQRVSFFESMTVSYKDSTIQIYNSDLTGTNEFTVVSFHVPFGTGEADCRSWIESQWIDGLFETSKYGQVVEISSLDLMSIINGDDLDAMHHKRYIEYDFNFPTKTAN